MRTSTIAVSGLFALAAALVACGTDAGGVAVDEPFFLCDGSPVELAAADVTLTFDGRSKAILEDGEINEVLVNVDTAQGTERAFFSDGYLDEPGVLTLEDDNLVITIIDTFASSPDHEDADCAEFVVNSDN